MKALFPIVFFAVIGCTLSAQPKQVFDIVTYIPPKGWKKQFTENALQLTKEDGARGTYCIITLYKAIPGTADSKENFDLAWASLVKEMVTVSAAPEMQAVENKEGWEIQSGYATFESDSVKGVVILVTASASEKMVNLIITTNTDVYEKEMTAFIESLSIKRAPEGSVKTKEVEDQATSTQSTTSGRFAFSTTNFDDGWTSIEKDNWVEVTKGGIKVLLHYPTDGIKAANTDVDVMCGAAWNFLVAPRYSNIQNYKVGPGVLDYERPYYAEASLTDNATGTTVFVVLFKKVTGWMEFITPDRETFIQAFGVDISKIDYYVETSVWNQMKRMANYNKFAIAATDFTGKWKDRFASSTYYANIYTGNSAGMSTYTSSEEFNFFAGNKYKWNLVAANSYGGASQFASAKGSGTFKVLNNWQIYFSEMEGKPKTFDAYFSCVKGGRILWMNDAKNPGSGLFSGFSKE
jgi:hypothetical protein